MILGKGFPHLVGSKPSNSFRFLESTLRSKQGQQGWRREGRDFLCWENWPHTPKRERKTGQKTPVLWETRRSFSAAQFHSLSLMQYLKADPTPLHSSETLINSFCLVAERGNI